jgi:hypothetical protein
VESAKTARTAASDHGPAHPMLNMYPEKAMTNAAPINTAGAAVATCAGAPKFNERVKRRPAPQNDQSKPARNASLLNSRSIAGNADKLKLVSLAYCDGFDPTSPGVTLVEPPLSTGSNLPRTTAKSSTKRRALPARPWIFVGVFFPGG